MVRKTVKAIRFPAAGALEDACGLGGDNMPGRFSNLLDPFLQESMSSRLFESCFSLPYCKEPIWRR